MKQISKRIKAVILVLTLLFGVMSPAMTIKVDAASKWKSAYKKFLQEPKQESIKNWDDFSSSLSWLREMHYVDGFERYFLCDVNKDKTPELFMCFDGGILTAVFTYRNGKIVYLGYDNFYGINKSKKLLLVYGHWHGASEYSGEEYTGYKIGKKELKFTFFTDWVVNRVVNEDTKKAYKEDCKKYVKGCKKFSSFKKYKLSNMKGLKAQ